MKRAALFLLPLSAALALPLLPLAGQDVTSDVQANAMHDGSEDFPWPDFLEVEPLPGRYRMTVVLENMSFPRFGGGKVDPGSADTMADALDEPDVSYLCLEGPPERVDWLAELSEGNCTSDGVTGGDDGFNISVQCDQPGGGRMDMQMSGSASETGLDMLMRTTMRGNEMGKMRMDVRLDVERVGDCE